MSLLRQLANWPQGWRSDPFEIDGIAVARIRPVRRTGSGSVVSKAGRVVLAAETADGHRLKIYEAASVRHAEFIRAAATIDLPGIRLPAVVGTSGRFVVSEWIQGDPLSGVAAGSARIVSLARLQAKFHSADGFVEGDSGFDYWRDFIRPRFVRAAELAGRNALGAEAIRIVDDWRAGRKTTLNHPDLSLDNVMMTADGDHIPIDNELLCCGSDNFMDVLNSLNSLRPDERGAYLRVYIEQPGIQPLPGAEILRAFWLARTAGSLFVAGKAARVARAFDTYGLPSDGSIEALF